MTGFRLSSARRLRATTLVELLISSAITSVMAIGLMVGAILVQRSFAASRHYMEAQAQQLRLTDFMALDLRRALTVNPAGERLTLTIPNYYDASGRPRDPAIDKGAIKYGPSPTVISYFKRGSSVVRSEGAAEAVLAQDVDDFRLTFQDLGQSVTASVTFVPRFQFSPRDTASVRDGTAIFATTLLRNKRQN